MHNFRNSSTTYQDPHAYWEERLSTLPNLRGTGARRFSAAYNLAMYEIAADRLKRILDSHSIDLAQKSILDVGPGFGYFIDRYIQWGASHVTGVDFTRSSVNFLSRTFPQSDFIQSDIADDNLILSSNYDVIFAISVIFHIVSEAEFSKALNNLCSALKPAGYLVLVDTFANQLFPLAKHTKFRTWASYEEILKAHNIKLISIHPMYYVMSRSIIPLLGPVILSWAPLIRAARKLDIWLEKKLDTNLGHLKFAILGRTWN